MIKRIINIDERKCNSCCLCISVCREGSIGLIGGKAKLLHDNYCDKNGPCIKICPTGAITFVEYDEDAAKTNINEVRPKFASTHIEIPIRPIKNESHAITAQEQEVFTEAHLNQWPVEIKLVPINAPYFQGADLLVAADCTAYAYSNFHDEFMNNKITIIGCPKLDDEDYATKLTAILKMNNIKSLTVVRMNVPCCDGIEIAAIKALEKCAKSIKCKIAVVSIQGDIVLH